MKHMLQTLSQGDLHYIQYDQPSGTQNGRTLLKVWIGIRKINNRHRIE